MPAAVWRLRSRVLDLAPGVVMGVINVTPDSFSDGGLHYQAAAAVEAGMAMAESGADLVDVGGESTRPGSEPVDAREELRRVLPVVEELSGNGIAVSIDTAKAEVAGRCIEAGAEVVNDVTAGRDTEMLSLIASSGVGSVLMHMKGIPRTMQESPVYDDVVKEVTDFLSSRVAKLIGQGADPSTIAIDPGIGFGKSVGHNLELIRGLNRLASTGHPVVLGTSRKSFLGKLTGIAEPAARDGATAVTTALGYHLGARVFRVHDVPSSRAALRMAAAIVAPERWHEWSPD